MRSILFSLLFIGSLFASQNDQVFNELLQKVKNAYKEQNLEDKRREAAFIKDVKKQQKLLSQMQKQVQTAKAFSKKLKNDIKTNEISLQNLSNELTLATGDLGELFGTVKQVSSDMKVHIKNSLVSSQYPNRQEFLKELTSKKELPNIKELEKLWYIAFQEIIEAGKVVRFKTDVISKEGSKNSEEVIRIGNFNAISKDAFLKYNSNNFLFVEPSFQPDYEYISIISNFFTKKNDIQEMVIDPTRGTILELISQKPNFKQRLSQGGVIGYIIVALGIVGVLFALIKYLWLSYISLKIKAQLKDIVNIKSNNPLGRILQAYELNKSLSSSDLEYRVDEAFFKEIPSLQSGFSMIKLFAATTPLLGLLGTVTGMILTFQSITLFGTSDPKLMAGGISQALITTMLGLIAAIPLLFTHTLLSSKAKKIINVLEQNAVALVAKKMDNNV